MKLTYLFLAGASALAMAACSPSDSGEPTGPDAATPPAETTDTTTPETTEGPDTAAAATYELEPTHAFLSFTVIHGGISEYTVDFTDFDATLDFDPENPASSSLEVTIDPTGLNVNYPSNFKAGHPDVPYETWPETLAKDARFLDADDYPQITFVSTGIDQTGDNTGTVTGDLTFLGVTKPVTPGPFCAMAIDILPVERVKPSAIRPALVSCAQSQNVIPAFGNRSETGIMAEPIIPNACSIPCICRVLTKASSVVIFIGVAPYLRSSRKW